MTADIHFSPLALTHALPFLPLAQGDIDYQVDRRSEPGLIDELLAEPTTKVVLTRGGLVAVPRGQGELVDYENVKMRLATLPGAYVSAELARYPEAVAMFLGSMSGRAANPWSPWISRACRKPAFPVLAGLPVLAVPSAACSAPRIPALWTARWARTASAEVLPPEYGSRETPRVMAA